MYSDWTLGNRLSCDWLVVEGRAKEDEITVWTTEYELYENPVK